MFYLSLYIPFRNDNGILFIGFFRRRDVVILGQYLVDCVDLLDPPSGRSCRDA